MGNSRIEQIIEEIEDYIDTCKGPLLGSSDKIVVNRERMEEQIKMLFWRMPRPRRTRSSPRPISKIRSLSMSMRLCSRLMNRPTR